MRPNNRCHYELLMQTVSRDSSRIESGWKKQVTLTLRPSSILPLRIWPVFFPAKRVAEDPEIRVTRRPLIPLIRDRVATTSLFFFFFFVFIESNFHKRAVTRAARRLTRGPVDLFMANWKRKLRGLPDRCLSSHASLLKRWFKCHLFFLWIIPPISANGSRKSSNISLETKDFS